VGVRLLRGPTNHPPPTNPITVLVCGLVWVGVERVGGWDGCLLSVSQRFAFDKGWMLDAMLVGCRMMLRWLDVGCYVGWMCYVDCTKGHLQVH
jgi:hypothetical protein